MTNSQRNITIFEAFHLSLEHVRKGNLAGTRDMLSALVPSHSAQLWVYGLK